jgi:hypothetical protein
MLEQTPKFETELRPAHLEYGAVPLDTWSALYPDGSGKDYANGSLSHISDKVQEAVAETVMAGTLGELKAHDLAEFMMESLSESQFHRIKLNSNSLSRDMLDENDERVQRALTGVATPQELFDILVDYPKLGSVELAKLSHPMKPLDSLPMDVDIETMLTKYGAEMLDEPAYHKAKLRDSSIPAVIILRKQPVADYKTEHGTIRVMQRKSVLVHAEDGASNDPYLERLVKNAERFDELIDKVGHAVDFLDIVPLGWLHVQATTYYAKYLPEAEEANISLQ